MLVAAPEQSFDNAAPIAAMPVAAPEQFSGDVTPIVAILVAAPQQFFGDVTPVVCQRRDFPPTATQPSVGSRKEIPEGGRERARGEVAGFQNSESGALS